MSLSKFKKLSTVSAAQKLLGSYLMFENTDDPLIGRIVETEAYLHDDPACHAFRGQTPRNQPMFGPPGFSYVYIIYGLHHCFNVVTNEKDVGEAVLIRALEPVSGIELMRERRKQTNIHQLCNGPGKLCSAFGITRKHNNIDLQNGLITIELHAPNKSETISSSKRIGITQGAELKYRYFFKNNKFVSR